MKNNKLVRILTGTAGLASSIVTLNFSNKLESHVAQDLGTALAAVILSLSVYSLSEGRSNYDGNNDDHYLKK